jgi:porin
MHTWRIAPAILGYLAAAPALAQAVQDPVVRPDDGGFFTGFWHRQNMLGDMGGLRTVLGHAGVTLGLVDTNEVVGNTTGGLKQGATYEGLTTLTLQLDTLKAFGWEGGLFNVSGLQIRGRDFSQYYLDNLQTVSGIEAQPTTRLWEIWYQQTFLSGRASVKIGQQSIDQEFMVSAGSSLFLNTMMGWPMVPSADLYAGGPAYPLSSLGVRVSAQPTGTITVLGGVFQDNPPGGPFDNDSQLLGTTRWGGNFNLRTGALVIGEVQYALNQAAAAGDMVQPGQQASGLPGLYKLGFWYDTAPFPSPRFSNDGLSLAAPASNGVPVSLRNNWSLYGVADQVVWQPDPQAARAVGVFARLMGAPGDRNLISFSANGGVTLKAPFHGRDGDTVGLGFGVAQVGYAASGLDRDTGFFTQSPYPVRGSEEFVELTYQAQITPWLQIQPDAQYIFNPGAGIPNPNNPSQLVKNAAVFGVRSNITF